MRQLGVLRDRDRGRNAATRCVERERDKDRNAATRCVALTHLINLDAVPQQQHVSAASMQYSSTDLDAAPQQQHASAAACISRPRYTGFFWHILGLLWHDA